MAAELNGPSRRRSAIASIAIGVGLWALGVVSGVAVWSRFHARQPSSSSGGTVPPLAAARHGPDADRRAASAIRSPRSPLEEDALAAALTDLARFAPARAIARALAETNRLLRAQLLRAALAGWASKDPTAAAEWVLQRPLDERGAAMDAILAAAAGQPAVAIALANRLIAEDPTLAYDYGCSLVLALGRRGDFAAAAQFAATASETHRGEWLDVAFAAWAQHRPEDAAAALPGLPTAEARTIAFKAVVAQWAQVDPPAAANYAVSLPTEPERRFALATALGAWAKDDVASVATWINRCEPSPELDAGVAAVATSPALARYRPAVAIEWAQSLVDPSTRVNALGAIIREWAKTNRRAATAYARDLPNVPPTDRELLMATLSAEDKGEVVP